MAGTATAPVLTDSKTLKEVVNCLNDLMIQSRLTLAAFRRLLLTIDLTS